MPLSPALIAARYAGRPTLIRGQELASYAQQLLALRGESAQPSGFASLLSMFRAERRSDRRAEDAERPVPQAYLPVWLGEAEASGHRWSFKDGVALIEIEGPLLPKGGWCWDTWVEGYDTLTATVTSALADARVRGIFLKWRSPGGVVDPGLAVFARIIRESRAAAGGKPIWSHADLMASAAYWGGCGSDRTLGAPFSMVGSIGCYMTHCDMSGYNEKAGFKITEIQFGEAKLFGTSNAPLTDEAQAVFQAEVDEIGNAFVGDVVLGRANLDREAVLATRAGCFLGRNAKAELSAIDLGLIDELIDEQQAFEALVAEVKQSAPSGASASAQEIDMKRSAMVAAMTAAGLSAAQIKATEDELDKAGEAEDEEGEDAPADEGAGEGAGAEGEDDKVDARTAKAILALPEAKGREGLANKLAFTGGMTVETAKGLLAAAPKGSTLAGLMQGQDPKVTASGGQVQTGAAPVTARDQFARNREAGLATKRR